MKSRNMGWVSSIAAGVLLAACGSDGSHDENPGATVDAGAEASDAVDPCDRDGDGYRATACGGDDCDDTRADIHPGAVDTCDGDDNNCDGVADEDDACDCAEPPPAPTLPYSDRVCLKGGWFWMGMAPTDPDATLNHHWAEPAHRVFVSPVYMDAYEVTNRRFIECLDAGKCERPFNSVMKTYYDAAEHSTPETADLPWSWTSRDAAEVFCEFDGGRLPTEAEWERAAAGLGDEPRPYPSGFSPPTCEEDITRGCMDPSIEYPVPVRVGTAKPNPSGIYDLGGNAKEFTIDRFAPDGYSACPEPCKNPCYGCPGTALESTKWTADVTGRGADVGMDLQNDSLRIFARSQARDWAFKSGYETELFARGLRCVHPAKPKR